MFTTILVPLDGSAASNVALPLARTVARETGASIILLRVVHHGERDGVADVKKTLTRIAAELAEAGVRVEPITCAGEDVAHEILEQSRAHSADLVIMRTHGRAGVQRAVLGSVTQKVLAESSVPVMVMRPGGRRVGQISKLLVPIDGSPGGSLALGTAVQLARSTGASLTLLQVSVPVPTWASVADAYEGMAYYDPAWDAEALASVREYVTSMVSRIREGKIEVDGEARQGPSIVETIVAVAEQTETDLIVMSTRALTGPARALLGSTADAVLRTAHCPVLLIHRADDDEQPAVEPASDTVEPAGAALKVSEC